MIYSKGQQLFMYYFKEKFFKNTTCKEYVRFTEKRPSHATLIGKIDHSILNIFTGHSIFKKITLKIYISENV